MGPGGVATTGSSGTSGCEVQSGDGGKDISVGEGLGGRGMSGGDVSFLSALVRGRVLFCVFPTGRRSGANLLGLLISPFTDRCCARWTAAGPVGTDLLPGLVEDEVERVASGPFRVTGSFPDAIASAFRPGSLERGLSTILHVRLPESATAATCSSTRPFTGTDGSGTLLAPFPVTLSRSGGGGLNFNGPGGGR